MVTNTNQRAVALKAKLFRGFSDPSRLSILEVLRSGPLAVNDICGATGLSQSNVSNHLACLRDCGLVANEQQGRHVHYRLSDPRVTSLLSTGDALLADVAREVYECTRYETLEGILAEAACAEAAKDGQAEVSAAAI